MQSSGWEVGWEPPRALRGNKDRAGGTEGRFSSQTGWELRGLGDSFLRVSLHATQEVLGPLRVGGGFREPAPSRTAEVSSLLHLCS